jgi:hypothetical protein
MEAQVRQLESRASGENPLSGFANSVKADAAREAALRRYFKTQPSDAPAALRAFNEELQALDRAWPATAFDRLTRLNRSGALEVQAIVGESPDLVRVRLQEALGKDVFDRYERDYQAERAELTTDMLITARSKGIRGAEPFEERPIEQKPEIRPEPRPIEIP